MKKKILVIGGSHMELTMNMYKIPDVGETIRDDGGVAYIPGGSGIGWALALSRLGAEAALTTKLGRDLHGQQLYTYLREGGVDTSGVKVDASLSTALYANIRTEGGVRRVIYEGACLTKDNIRDAFSTSPDALTLSLDLPVELTIYALACAEARGIPVFLDAVGAEDGYPLESLPPVEIFSPNEEETEKLVGILPIGAQDSLRAAVSLFRRVKCKYLVIKQGERGAFIYDGKHYFMIPPINAGKPIDTSGAGDAFNAGLVLRYLISGGDIKGAVQYGSVVAGIAITKRGSAVSVPTEGEVIDFLEKYTS